MTSLDELTLIGTQLENEAEMLEYFPRVKARLQAIEEAKVDAEKQDVLLTSAMAEAKEDLASAEEAAKKAIENAEKAKQIDDEIAEIELEMEEAKAKGRKQKVIDAYLGEIEEKRTEKAELGTEEEWTQAMDAAKEPEERIESIKKGQKKIARVINKCSNPWSTILKGYGWMEIGELTSDDLSQMIGVQVKRSELDKYENNYEDKKDKNDKDDKKEKDKDGKGAKGGAMPRGGDYYIPPAPEPELDKPDEGTEHDDNDKPDEQPEHDDNDKPDNTLLAKTWSERNPKIAKWLPFLAKFMDTREANKKLSKEERKALGKAREEEFVKKFREENKGEPSWWQKFKARYFGEKDDDRKDPPAPPSGGREGEAPASAEATQTPEQTEPEPTPAQPDKDVPVAEADKTREDILKEVTGLSLREIQERKGAWGSKFSDKEIKLFEKVAHTREQHAKESLERLEAKEAREKALKSKEPEITFKGRRSAFREAYSDGVKVPKAPVVSDRGSSQEPTLAPADGPALQPEEGDR